MRWNTRPAGVCRLKREADYAGLGYFIPILVMKSVSFAIGEARPYRAALEQNQTLSRLPQ
jgi:hypothetical protein